MSIIPAQIQAVCFDAVGTLIFPDPPAHQVYAEVGASHGSRYETAAIRERFAEAFAVEEARDEGYDWQTSEERERNRWKTIVASVLDDVADTDVCFQQLYQHFSEPSAWRCNEYAEAVLEVLSMRDFALAMASNYDHRLRSVVAGFHVLKPVSHLIISAEVGWRKPSPAFFAAIARSLQLSSDQILYIGDDRATDYDGATAVGFSAILYDPAAKESIMPHQINDLRQLLE